jgi:hypothetical protein
MCRSSSTPIIQLSKQPLVQFITFLLLVVPGLQLFAAKPSEPSDVGFELQDFLGRRWQNESIRFPLSPDQLKSARARRALIGPDDKPVPYQIVFADTPTTPAIEFLVDLEPYESRTYRFTQSVATAAIDLQLEETSDVIRLGNSQVGIAVRKKTCPGRGPHREHSLGLREMDREFAAQNRANHQLVLRSNRCPGTSLWRSGMSDELRCTSAVGAALPNPGT